MLAEDCAKAVDARYADCISLLCQRRLNTLVNSIAVLDIQPALCSDPATDQHKALQGNNGYNITVGLQPLALPWYPDSSS